MKWLLYLTCVRKTFSEEMFKELEAFASSRLESEPKDVFDAIQIKGLPFTHDGDKIAFASYMKHLNQAYPMTAFAQHQGEQKKEIPTKPQTLATPPLYQKLHNRVMNGDITAIILNEDGSYALGDAD